MPTQYDILGDDDSEGNEVEEGLIPNYEDLSTTRIDEETVLDAVYGDDYYRKDGPWGTSILCVKVNPPDVEQSQIFSQLT